MMDESTVTSPRFSWRMSESYYMSIQLSLDGLSFCILDPVTNIFHSLTEVSYDKEDANFAQQEQYILSCPDMQRKFRKVLICIDSPAFSLMPISLYDESRIRSVLALTGINVANDDKILRNNIDLANSTTAFTVPNFLYFFLKNQFAGAEIFHSTTPIVSSMLLKRQGGALGTQMNIAFGAKDMTVVVAKDNELLLCNRFYCKEALDYVYMLLYIAEQLSLDIKTTQVTVHGRIASDDIRVRQLRKFIRLVQMAQIPQYFSYGFAIPEQAHRFNTLFLTPLCV